MINTLKRWLVPDVAYVPTTPPSLQDYVPFLAIVLLYPVFLLAVNPYGMLGGQMWAEMATNYYVNGSSPSWWTRLFATDAGYIPLPQRLIVALGEMLSVPPVSVPYFYTWSASVLLGAMVASFSLPVFRAVMRSDLVRATVCVILLLTIDFETRTFINFTYFGAFVAVILSALAITRGEHGVPKWAWVLPVIVLSKPAVLAVLPAMVLAALVSGVRFRLITALSVLVGLVQVVRLLASRAEGTFQQSTNPSLLEKLSATVTYFFALPTAFVNGATNNALNAGSISLGLLFVILAGAVFIARSERNYVLILTSTLVIFFSVLLNAMTQYDRWNMDMARLAGPNIHRDVIIPFISFVLIMAAVVHDFGSRLSRGHQTIAGAMTAVVLALWFFGAGWYTTSTALNTRPVSPHMGNSHWHQLSDDLDANDDPLCIPVDPYPWIMGRNCAAIGDIPAFGGYVPVDTVSGQVRLPPDLADRTLVSLGVLARPPKLDNTASVSATITLRDGQQVRLSTERPLLPDGGMIMLSPTQPIAGRDIASVAVESEPGSQIAVDAGDVSSPLALFMGY